MESPEDMMGKVFIQSDNIVSRKILDETILVPVSGNVADMQKVFTLNSVGEYIWNQLDGNKNLNDITAGIIKNFEVEPLEAGNDMLDFIEELLEARLILEKRDP